jgi:hypothetical protein
MAHVMGCVFRQTLRGPRGRHSNQLQEGKIDGQLLKVSADDTLVEGTAFLVQVGQARLAHSVTAAQAYGTVARLVEHVVANGTGEEFRPLWGLHRHFDLQVKLEFLLLFFFFAQSSWTRVVSKKRWMTQL